MERQRHSMSYFYQCAANFSLHDFREKNRIVDKKGEKGIVNECKNAEKKVFLISDGHNELSVLLNYDPGERCTSVVEA
jgi:hypothetical protein